MMPLNSERGKLKIVIAYCMMHSRPSPEIADLEIDPRPWRLLERNSAWLTECTKIRDLYAAVNDTITITGTHAKSS